MRIDIGGLSGGGPGVISGTLGVSGAYHYASSCEVYGLWGVREAANVSMFNVGSGATIELAQLEWLSVKLDMSQLNATNVSMPMLNVTSLNRLRIQGSVKKVTVGVAGALKQVDYLDLSAPIERLVGLEALEMVSDLSLTGIVNMTDAMLPLSRLSVGSGISVLYTKFLQIAMCNVTSLGYLEVIYNSELEVFELAGYTAATLGSLTVWTNERLWRLMVGNVSSTAGNVARVDYVYFRNNTQLWDVGGGRLLPLRSGYTLSLSSMPFSSNVTFESVVDVAGYWLVESSIYWLESYVTISGTMFENVTLGNVSVAGYVRVDSNSVLRTLRLRRLVNVTSKSTNTTVTNNSQLVGIGFGAGPMAGRARSVVVASNSNLSSRCVSEVVNESGAVVIDGGGNNGNARYDCGAE